MSRNWFEPIKSLQLSRKVDQGVNDDDFRLDASKMHSKYSFQLRYWDWSGKGFKYFEWIIAAHFAAKVKKNISKYFITNLSRFQNYTASKFNQIKIPMKVLIEAKFWNWMFYCTLVLCPYWNKSSVCRERYATVTLAGFSMLRSKVQYALLYGSQAMVI